MNHVQRLHAMAKWLAGKRRITKQMADEFNAIIEYMLQLEQKAQQQPLPVQPVIEDQLDSLLGVTCRMRRLVNDMHPAWLERVMQLYGVSGEPFELNEVRYTWLKLDYIRFQNYVSGVISDLTLAQMLYKKNLLQSFSFSDDITLQFIPRVTVFGGTIDEYLIEDIRTAYISTMKFDK